MPIITSAALQSTTDGTARSVSACSYALIGVPGSAAVRRSRARTRMRAFDGHRVSIRGGVLVAQIGRCDGCRASQRSVLSSRGRAGRVAGSTRFTHLPG